MDIEGAEYEVLTGTDIKTLALFRIIVMEIHDVENWSNPRFFSLVKEIFDKLLSEFYIAHMHPNNCCGLFKIDGLTLPRVFEVTLHRRDRVKNLQQRNGISHNLDSPTVLDRSELKWRI